MLAYARDNTNTIQPYYVGASNVGCSLSIASGIATCQGYVTLKSGYTASSTLKLQRSTNGTSWTTLQTWNGSGTIPNKTRSVSSGYKFRI